MAERVSPEALRFRCPDEWIPTTTSEGIPAAAGIVGQERGVRALEFGLAMDSPGFNVFVTGLVGTGKMTAVELHLRRLCQGGPRPEDLCYVFNFQQPERPKLLRLPAGGGAVLRERLGEVVRQLASWLPALLSSAEVQRLLEERLEDLEQRRTQLLRRFEAQVQEAGFSLVQVQVGAVTHPEILAMVEGRPVSMERLQRLAEEGKFPKAEADRLAELHQRLLAELQQVVNQVLAIGGEMQEKALELRRAIVQPRLHQALGAIAQQVADPRVEAYLREVEEDILAHLQDFVEGSPSEETLIRYAVNLLVDHSQTVGRPVVVETDPSLANLLGTVEARLLDGGHPTTDHTRIRAGSLVRANGGFLVLNAMDVLTEPGAWPALKRALRHQKVVIRPRETLFALSGQALQPEPVELSVKVVMLGDRGLFDALWELDEEFGKIFKVLADFDRDTPLGQREVEDFLRVMAKIVREEGLPHLDREGMKALVEEGVRLGGPRRRLSARFSDVADILREAGYLARQQGSPLVGAGHIAAAMAARRTRFALPEEKLLQFMLDQLLVVHTEGWAVGQVNGLAVYDLGYFAFGLPGRVTARVSLGTEGVVNVEREARLSGRTHDKGVLILTGFLRGSFILHHPLSMHASIAFEQSYAGVEGDSASSAEVYAILSALSGLPLRQDLAVTGSVDQLGNVQAIGGVNPKIEGFFALCQARGLTGTQGVIIPKANVPDLHLSPEVVEAVHAGRFHVYAVSHVAEGLELLTGVPAGVLDASGRYLGDTVFGRCQARLEAMAEALRRFRR
ncbi:MAG: AAA family ATPase [Thermoanaerobaculum sp.]|nr:AAA family ATPase [Thermoanaerobaculum sp.]MDW7967849.1 ATP-binding protein [Thermoanaerobaculum sp.]